ncbi:MAG: ABC transporter ATP-binding protein [Streptococcus sp.]|nr:ABC transporter ATP-binding protein [Streptococcus sp.]
MFQVKNLCKSFGHHLVLNDLSMELDKQGITVIVGLNGVGKTVFCDSITGMIPYDKGTVVLDGNPIQTKEFKKNIFYVPSDFFLPEYLTGLEYAQFVQSRYDNSNIEVFKEIASILEMTESLKKRIEFYSFGMKKKLQIALALSLNVDYLIADEIFSGLDLETVIIVQELFHLYTKNHQILLISHERNIINQFSNHILLMADGKLTKFNGTVDELSEYIYKQGKMDEKLERIKKLI